MPTIVIRIDQGGCVTDTDIQGSEAAAAGRGDYLSQIGERIGERIAPAVEALAAGRLVAFPTETVYGVGVVAANSEAVDRLRELKGRPAGGFTVHLSCPEEARWYVKDIPLPARTLMKKAWPGPLTVLLPVGGRLTRPDLRGKGLLERVAPDGVVGLRCPDHPVTKVLLERVGKCVLASSANLPGRRPPVCAADVLAQIDGKIDLLVDSGRTRHTKASTIVAFEGNAHKVVREGVYDADEISRMIRRRILFVCTGNTCRSPMAAALARKMLAARLGCRVDELKKLGQEVDSAGVFAATGTPATDNAVSAAGSLGADASGHRAKKLTDQLIISSDLIFCMGRSHVAEVVRRVPQAAGKTFLLDAESDIEDPIGGDSRVYLRVARRIERWLKKRARENLL